MLPPQKFHSSGVKLVQETIRKSHGTRISGKFATLPEARIGAEQSVVEYKEQLTSADLESAVVLPPICLTLSHGKTSHRGKPARSVTLSLRNSFMKTIDSCRFSSRIPPNMYHQFALPRSRRPKPASQREGRVLIVWMME